MDGWTKFCQITFDVSHLKYTTTTTKKYDYGYGYEKTFGNDHLKLSKKLCDRREKGESFHYIDVIN